VQKNSSNNDAETSNEETLSPIEQKKEKLSKTPKNTLSTEQLPSVPLDGFADKVRKVAFAGAA